jgi:hypothetical protein
VAENKNQLCHLSAAHLATVTVAAGIPMCLADRGVYAASSPQMQALQKSSAQQRYHAEAA